MSYGDRLRRLRAMNAGHDVSNPTTDERHVTAVVDEILAERVRSEILALVRDDGTKTDNDWQDLIVDYASRIGTGYDTRYTLMKIANIAIAAIVSLDRKHVAVAKASKR